MKQKILKVCMVVVLVGCFGSVALALDPMGPPKAGLEIGQWNLGIEYSYSEMRLDRQQFGGSASGLWPKFDVKSNKIYGRFGYGFSDRWEGFFRIGASEFDYKRDAGSGQWKGTDGDSLSYGGGMKATFTENERVAWGFLAQISWSEYRGSRKNPNANTTDGEFKTDFYEIQLAAGPTFKLSDRISIYGGPFLHFVDGKHYYWGTDDQKRGADLKQNNSFGAYVGAQIKCTANSDLTIEYQSTNDAWSISTGFVWKF